MSTGRMIARAAVSAVASLALVTGAGAGTALAAETTAAAQCTTETQQAQDAQQRVKTLKKKLKKAKKALKKAKNAGDKPKIKKLKKKVKKLKRKLANAKANLQTQRAEADAACAAADQEAAALTAALAELQKRIAEFAAMKGSTDVDALPADVSGPMEAAFGELLVHLETLKAQLPAADLAGLQGALAMLQALDPTQLQGAIADLAAEIRGGAESGDLQALLDSLLAGVPGAETGNMADVKAAFEALVAQLESFDPASAEQQLPTIAAKVREALQALQDHSSMLQDVLTALTALNGGALPSDPAQFQQLLGTLLTALAGGGSVGDVLDDLLDPLDPILDPLDPILDPLDPVLDPLTGAIEDLLGGLTGGLFG